MAERHVREGDRRMSELRTRISELERDGYEDAAHNARSLLFIFEETQRFALNHLCYKRELKQ